MYEEDAEGLVATGHWNPLEQAHLIKARCNTSAKVRKQMIYPSTRYTRSKVVVLGARCKETCVIAATPTSYKMLMDLAREITQKVHGLTSCCF